MSLNWKFVIVGLFVSVAGGWLIFRPGTNDPRTAGGDLSSASVIVPESNPANATPESEDQTYSGQAAASADPSTEAVKPSGEELGNLTLQTIPTSTTTSTTFDSDCDASYAGLGVEYRAWGDVLLPYTPGYPTTDPGEVWDCTADSAFGGAIAMVHAAYLEALRPDVILDIAADTPGRTARIGAHSSTNNSASLGFLCAPIGWNWDQERTWSLLHQCGEGDPRVSFYDMEYRSGRWWLVYPSSGEIETVPPPADYEYYAFIGGD